jgi:peptidoglycan hydrolase-like protein with peptidoglycan-binding domain
MRGEKGLKGTKHFFCSVLILLMLTSTAYADTYKTGSGGEEVKEIQQRLKRMRVYHGELDGEFDQATEEAVKRFQVKRGLFGDGIVEGRTYEYLMGRTASNTSQALMRMTDVQLALKQLGYYKGSIDGVADGSTLAAVKSFQEANRLPADGRLGQDTRDLLMSVLQQEEEAVAETAIPDVKQSPTPPAIAIVPAKASDVRLLDWWTEASMLFKIGTKARVTDVGTGITFNIARTYGYNHADSEALTAADSSAMKKAWGGSWSWTRRPVIIEIDGIKIAASIAAMPHAGVDSAEASVYVDNRSGGFGSGYNLDKIKNNGMNGVVDVHFLNSKTHGTNRVDGKHQEAIKEAAEAFSNKR